MAVKATLATMLAAAIAATTAGATTTDHCLNEDGSECRATTSEKNATSAIAQFGRWSGGPWRLVCTRGSKRTVNQGRVRFAENTTKTVFIRISGKPNCRFTALASSRLGKRSAVRVTVVNG